jgi:hypothetical protein
LISVGHVLIDLQGLSVIYFYVVRFHPSLQNGNFAFYVQASFAINVRLTCLFLSFI